MNNLKAIDPMNIKFKCFDFPKDQQIKVISVQRGWRIGKVKGLIRQEYRINPSYNIELTLKGNILNNDKIVEEITLNPEKDIIKVIISSPY